MTWEGKTPTVAIDNDVTPTVSNRCSCGDELIYVDGDEKPPLTQEEISLQFHCLMSRGGDWFFCMHQGATWVRMAVR
jgi:hypothetical protein